MASSNIKNIKKLQQAINHTCDFKILYQTSQFYSTHQPIAVQKYIIKKAVYDAKSDRYESEEIFSAYSQLQIILYLRDLWYTINDIPLPTDNEVWERIKQENKIDYKDVIS